MRFSIWPTYSDPWDEIVSLVRHCEETGWDGVYFADHFMPNTADGAPADGPAHECWATLAGLAVAVPRLRLGSLVSGNTYRHPAVLAKMATTIDHLSGGRVVLGIGAGWQENEHRAYGIPLPPVRERLDRLDESCQVILGLLRQPRTTFAGRYYQLTDAPSTPSRCSGGSRSCSAAAASSARCASPPPMPTSGTRGPIPRPWPTS